jgi:hypothetical protein
MQLCVRSDRYRQSLSLRMRHVLRVLLGSTVRMLVWLFVLLVIQVHFVLEVQLLSPVLQVTFRHHFQLKQRQCVLNAAVASIRLMGVCIVIFATLGISVLAV